MKHFALMQTDYPKLLGEMELLVGLNIVAQSSKLTAATIMSTFYLTWTCTQPDTDMVSMKAPIEAGRSQPSGFHDK